MSSKLLNKAIAAASFAVVSVVLGYCAAVGDARIAGAHARPNLAAEFETDGRRPTPSRSAIRAHPRAVKDSDRLLPERQDRRPRSWSSFWCVRWNGCPAK
jgi:hypothetical protein